MSFLRNPLMPARLSFTVSKAFLTALSGLSTYIGQNQELDNVQYTRRMKNKLRENEIFERAHVTYAKTSRERYAERLFTFVVH